MKIAQLNLNSEEKRLLWHLRTQGPTPRTELSTVLQVSNSALTKLARNLLNIGLLEELDSPDAQGRGRPTVPLAISAVGGFAVGATVHKGVLEVALVDYAGGIISKTSEEIGAPSPAEFARHLEDRIADLFVKHRLMGMRFLGIGVGIPGAALSRDGDRWHVVQELPGWRNVPLRQIFDEALGVTVLLENDAGAAALAEYYLGGSMRRTSTVVVFLLGYGIGAGVIEDGRLIKGEFGGSGEIGMLYPGNQPRPSTMDLLAMLQGAGCDITSVAHFEEATVGYEDLIERWLVRASDQIEPVVQSAIAWFDPGEIIISSPLPEALMARLATKLSRGRLDWAAQRQPSEIRVSKLGGSSTALGAALLRIHASTAMSYR